MRPRTLTHEAEPLRRSQVSFAGRMRGLVVIAAAGLALARLGLGESRPFMKLGVGLAVVFVFVFVGSLFERDEAQERQT